MKDGLYKIFNTNHWCYVMYRVIDGELYAEEWNV